MKKQLGNFRRFYAFYLTEHRKRGTRILHFLGTSGFLAAIGFSMMGGHIGHVAMGIIFAYGLSWASHFVLEKNRPATFRYPVFSFFADLRMFAELLTGRLSWQN